MKKSNTIKSVLLTAFLGVPFTLSILNAAPAIPTSVENVQPNGEKIQVKVHGDEYFSYKTTEDGFVVTEDSEGYIVYANQNADKDSFVPSNVRVHNKSKRTAEENSYRKKLSPGLTQKQIKAAERKIKAGRQDFIEKRGPVLNVSGSATNVSKTRSADENAQYAAAHSGQRKFCIILVQFANVRFSHGQSNFWNMLNQSGYSANGSTGSTADYLKACSWNKFQPTFDVWGPVTVSQNRAFYGSDGGDVGSMVYEACQRADGLGANFADYDTDGDGIVDNVYCIFAGYDQAQGGPEECIWSHASGIGHKGLYLDGKQISGYGCSSELKWASGTEQVNIGTFTHEFGHVIGLPDFYDTDGNTNGNGHTPGSWSVMAGGCYNNDSRTPPLYGAIERQQLGWCTIPKCPDGAITLNKIQNSSNTPGYKINTDTNDEFYVLEYRERTGFDSSLPGSGMLIWHVDRSSNRYISFETGGTNYDSYFTGKILWDNWNSPNNKSGHPCYDLVECSNPHTNNGDTPLNESSMWPNGGRNSYQPYGWSGAATSPLTNIVNHGTYATFNCNGGGGEETTCTKTDRAVVTFYKDINYGGDAVGLPEGSFTKSQMGAYCLEDNWVSSLKVLPGYKVTVYVDDNFGGSSKTHTSNVSYVGDDWNDKISSIKIEPKGVSGFSGIYKIKGHNGQYLDLDGNSSENNTHVVQFTDEGTEFYQQWRFTESGNGVYTISPASAQTRAMDVSWGKVDNRTEILIYDNNNTPNQQFIVVDAGDGYYQLVARHCGKVIEVPDFSKNAGEWIKLYENNKQTCSFWQFKRLTPEGNPVATIYDDINYASTNINLPEGTYTKAELSAYGFIDNTLTSVKVLPGFKITLYADDNFGGTSKIITSNTNYVGGDFNDKTSSLKIEAEGVSGKAGTYKIKGRNSNLYWDLKANSLNAGTKIVQYNDEKAEQFQQFKLEELGKGIYTIYANTSKMVLDINNASAENRAAVQIWTSNNSKCQQYILVDAGDGYYQLVARHCGKVIEVPDNSSTADTELKTWDNNNQKCSHWKLEQPYHDTYDYWVILRDGVSDMDSYLDLRNNSFAEWDGTVSQTVADEYEGENALAYTVNAVVGGWFGFGVLNTSDTYYFGDLASYSLHFAYKTDYNGPLFVKMGGVNGEFSVQFTPTSDNKWHTKEINMSKFTEAGLQLGTTTNNLIFSIISENVVKTGATINVDDIYYYKNTVLSLVFTDIEDAGMTDISVYQPSNNKIAITGIEINTEIELMNLNGKTIMSSVSSDTNTVLNVENLPKGLYLLHIGNTIKKVLLK